MATMRDTTPEPNEPVGHRALEPDPDPCGRGTVPVWEARAWCGKCNKGWAKHQLGEGRIPCPSCASTLDYLPAVVKVLRPQTGPLSPTAEPCACGFKDVECAECGEPR